MAKDYYGKCGSCKYCQLGDSYTVAYSTKFNCSRYDRYVKADESACGKFEPASGRTSDIIAKYDK